MRSSYKINKEINNDDNNHYSNTTTTTTTTTTTEVATMTYVNKQQIVYEQTYLAHI